jgi:amino acid transporter
VSERSAEERNRDRQLIELLNELRVALPGVQVLFAFLLIVPFSNGWQHVTDLQTDAYYVAFLCAALASIFLIAPSVHHRLLWRHGQKERILVTANRSAIVGTAFLAAGMVATVFLITDVLFSSTRAAFTAALIAGCFTWFWYVLPFWRWVRQ